MTKLEIKISSYMLLSLDLILQYNSIMEDYVFIDSVLQATHMRRINRNERVLDKIKPIIAERKTTAGKINHNEEIYSKTDRRQDTQKAFKGSDPVEGKKIMTKVILDDWQKIDEENANHHNSGLISQFFLKRTIQPKPSRESTQRSYALCKTPEVHCGFYYDSKLDSVKKKSRNCIILPQKNPLKQIETNRPAVACKVNIKEIIKREIQEANIKRRAQCKTAGNFSGRKPNMRRDQKGEQQPKMQEKTIKRCDKSHLKYLSGESLNKKVMPMSKQEMKTHSSSIMKKYGLDSSKYFCKIMGNN